MGIRAQKSFPKSPAEGLALGRGVWVRVHIAGALETGPDWQHRHGPPICNYIIENLMLECPTWYPTRPKVHRTLPRVSSVSPNRVGVAFRNKARHVGCPVRCHFSSLVDDLADGLNCTHYTSSPHPRPTDWDQAPAPPGPPRLFPGEAPAPPDTPGFCTGGAPAPPDPPGNSDCRKHVKMNSRQTQAKRGQVCMCGDSDGGSDGNC